MSNETFCKDCKFCRYLPLPSCTHKLAPRDPVDGRYANPWRMRSFFNHCGPEAKWYVTSERARKESELGFAFRMAVDFVKHYCREV